MVKPFIYGKPRPKHGRKIESAYLLLESGGKILLEKTDGAILLEHQDIRVTGNWNMSRDGRL